MTDLTCDKCNKEIMKGKWIRPKDNEEMDYNETMFVCQDCFELLTQ